MRDYGIRAIAESVGNVGVEKRMGSRANPIAMLNGRCEAFLVGSAGAWRAQSSAS